MALTVGDYLYQRLVPQATDVHMNLGDVEVLHAQVANKAKGSTQPLALEAQLDLATRSMSLAWFNVSAETGERGAESFASGVVRFEDAEAWRAEWDRVTHLVLGRVEALEHMVATGRASRLSKRLAYTLFKNVVDYADRYRGMDSVVLHEYEAVADVTLVPERHGTWHTPPHWIDSVSHLAGLIMNGSDASNTHDYFYVTPGCDSFRLLKPLEAGAKYRSYARMFPLPVEAGNMYAGDVYILQDDTIVGMVGQIRFRRVPRLLMDRFFSPPSDTGGAKGHNAPAAQKTSHRPAAVASTQLPVAPPMVNGVAPQVQLNGTTTTTPRQPQRGPKGTLPFRTKTVGPTRLPTPPSETVTPPPEPARWPHGVNGAKAHNVSDHHEHHDHDHDHHETPETATPAESDAAESGAVEQCLRLMARETGLQRGDLTADATFVQLGVDSLMSLVLAEKFRSELGVEVKSSLFLECPTIGDMQAWLEQYC